MKTILCGLFCALSTLIVCEEITTKKQINKNRQCQENKTIKKEVIKELCKNCNDKWESFRKYTTFQETIEAGDVCAIKHFLDLGSDPNERFSYDEKVNSPLCLTCSGGHSNATKLLLAYNANKNRCNKNSVYFPESNYRVDVWTTPLNEAIRSGNVATVQVLLNEKVNLKEKDPLESAVRWGNIEIVTLLLKHGAVANKQHVEQAINARAIEIAQIIEAHLNKK